MYVRCVDSGLCEMNYYCDHEETVLTVWGVVSSFCV